MTDNEIIKALECCTQQAGCSGCPFVISNEICSEALLQNTLDLINRLQDEKQALINGQETLQNTIVEQKAEIERLKHRKTELQIRNQELQHEKSEAIKEFAERLKHFIIPQKADGYTREIVLKRDIDNLVKEMTEVPE